MFDGRYRKRPTNFVEFHKRNQLDFSPIIAYPYGKYPRKSSVKKNNYSMFLRRMDFILDYVLEIA